MIKADTRQAYSEVDEFIELLNEKEKQKIPQNLRDLFKREKDKEYVKNIDIQVPIKEQNLKRETLAIIAMLNLKYWCEDEKEKERLKQIYKNNGIKNEQEKREKYDPDKIFKQKEYNEIQEVAIIRKSKLKSIIDRIKKFFRKNTY